MSAITRKQHERRPAIKHRITESSSLAERIEYGRHLKNVRDMNLADHIGGFWEYVAMIGFTRQQAERLMKFAEKVAEVRSWRCT